MKRFIASIATLLIPVAPALASPFTDVPDSHPYAAAIADLHARGVVTGDRNPDGSLKYTFRPGDDLNRAEFAALVSRAAGRTPRAVGAGCRTDLPPEKWFSVMICDLIQAGFVQGYPNNTFGPENKVIAVEGIKMVLTILGFTVPELSQEDRLSLDLLGVTHGSWYAPFLHRALVLQLIPAALTKENTFLPDAPLLRGEAAEMIHRALNTEDLLPTEEVPREPGEEEEMLPTGAVLTAFPLHRTGKTGERGAASYAFDLTSAGTILVEATNLSETPGSISCFLYLLGESGFSHEFFVGYEEGSSCFIRAALRPGRYQLEVRTKTEEQDFSLDAEPSSGDGNDGFLEAISLRPGTPRAGVLPAHDYEDWFRFTIDETKRRLVNLSSQAKLNCTIYPGEDVDLLGEQGPQCGVLYEYPPGTYHISVKRASPATKSYPYTIELR